MNGPRQNKHPATAPSDADRGVMRSSDSLRRTICFDQSDLEGELEPVFIPVELVSAVPGMERLDGTQLERLGFSVGQVLSRYLHDRAYEEANGNRVVQRNVLTLVKDVAAALKYAFAELDTAERRRFDAEFRKSLAANSWLSSSAHAYQLLVLGAMQHGAQSFTEMSNGLMTTSQQLEELLVALDGADERCRDQLEVGLRLWLPENWLCGEFKGSVENALDLFERAAQMVWVSFGGDRVKHGRRPDTALMMAVHDLLALYENYSGTTATHTAYARGNNYTAQAQSPAGRFVTELLTHVAPALRAEQVSWMLQKLLHSGKHKLGDYFPPISRITCVNPTQ